MIHKERNNFSFSMMRGCQYPLLLLIASEGVLSCLAFLPYWPLAVECSARSCKLMIVHAKRPSWSTDDDWSSLSMENTENWEDTRLNVDYVEEAARAMEASQYSTNFPQDTEDSNWLDDVIDNIQGNGRVASDPPLYDSFSDPDTEASKISFMDEAGMEIAMLVHCNEKPETLLIQEGRALPPLTKEERDDLSQLLVESSDGIQVPSEFFKQAVSKMFQEHATPVPGLDGEDPKNILDAGGIAAWMTKSLNEVAPIGMFDKRVSTVIAKYSSHGTGVLTMDQFLKLYIDAASNGEKARPSQFGAGYRRRKLQNPTLTSVWRDIRNHGMLSPVEAERARLEQEMAKTNGRSTDHSAPANARSIDPFDECEILDYGVDSIALGRSTEWAAKQVSRKDAAGRSSYELVELASDKKTPKRIRDGEFVFIDEESCIGCSQCAQVSPSSFVMLDNGRARTHSQRRAEDVPIAVSTCPVSCMHMVSFDELKEMEDARDRGDGRSDHMHIGVNFKHTPLNVAGIDSDANHKSSWYHYLKQKCHMSNSCPQRGCYECPHYDAPGQNPYWQDRHRHAEHVRAQDFINSGEVDNIRKTAEL